MRRREVLTWRVEHDPDGERSLSIRTDHGAVLFMGPYEDRLSDTVHFISFEDEGREQGCFLGAVGADADYSRRTLTIRLVEALGAPLELVFKRANDLKIAAMFVSENLD